MSSNEREKKRFVSNSIMPRNQLDRPQGSGELRGKQTKRKLLVVREKSKIERNLLGGKQSFEPESVDRPANAFGIRTAISAYIWDAKRGGLNL